VDSGLKEARISQMYVYNWGENECIENSVEKASWKYTIGRPKRK
jgi:hypothetical protein